MRFGMWILIIFQMGQGSSRNSAAPGVWEARISEMASSLTNLFLGWEDRNNWELVEKFFFSLSL